MAMSLMSRCGSLWWVMMMVVMMSTQPIKAAEVAGPGPTTASLTAPDTSLVYAKCSAYPIPNGSPFWGHLGTTLYQLAENTAYANYDFSTQNGGGNYPAFGHASCSPNLAPFECCDCLKHLSYHIWSICNDAISAEVKFGDCSLHYEPISL